MKSIGVALEGTGWKVYQRTCKYKHILTVKKIIVNYNIGILHAKKITLL